MSREEFLILDNGDLYIDRLTRKYEGTYLCQAKNEHGGIETKTVLKVRPVHFTPPPLIAYGPQNQTVPVNTKAELECSVVRSSPHDPDEYSAGDETNAEQAANPTVKWFKDGKLISVDPTSEVAKYRLTDHGTLHINSLQM